MARDWNLQCWRLHRVWPVSLLFLCMVVHAPRAVAATPVTDDVWLMDSKVALKLFDCSDLLCGRIVWLVIPRDAQGVLLRDWRTRHFGMRSFGTLLGFVNSATATAIAPFVAGVIFDHTGGYTALLVAGIPLLLVAGLVVLSLGPYPQFKSLTV